MDISSIISKLTNGQKLNKEEISFLITGIKSYSERLSVAEMDPTEISDYFEKILKNLNDNEKELEGIVDTSRKRENILEEYLDTVKIKIELMVESGEYAELELKYLQDIYKTLTQQLKEQEAFKAGMQKGAGAAKSLLQTTLGLSTEWSMLGKAGGASGMMKGFLKGLYDASSFTNILGTLASQMFQRLFEFDSAKTEAFSATGIKKENYRLQKMAAKLGGGGTKKAISADQYGDINKAHIAMQNNIQNFMTIGQLSREQMTESAAVLTKLGVSAQDSAKMYGTMINTFKYTPEEADRAVNSFAKAATEMGRPPGEIISAYNKQMPILARFGKRGEQIFLGMAAEASRLNIDVHKVASFGERTDTIAGAAKTAQAFNFAIGQPFLSAHALLAASPEEKLEIIRKAYQDADSPPLGERQIRALANATGLAVDEIQRVLNSQQSVVDETKGKAKAATSSQEQNLELARENASIATQVAAQMKALIDAILHNLFGDNAMDGALNMIGKLASKMKSILAILGGLAAFKFGFGLFMKRGSHMGNPEFVRDVSFGLGGGKGKLAGAMRILGGATMAAGAVAGGLGVTDAMGWTNVYGGDTGDTWTDVKPASIEESMALAVAETGGLTGTGGTTTRGGTMMNVDASSRKGGTTNVTAPSPRSSSTVNTAGSRGSPISVTNPGGTTINTRSSSSGGSARAPSVTTSGTGGGTSVAAPARPPSLSVSGAPAGSVKVGNLNAPGGVVKVDDSVGLGGNFRGNMNQNNADYIYPVFNKDDKFYAAKSDGVLAKAFDEVIKIVASIAQKKKESSRIEIKGKDFIAGADAALKEARRYQA